MKRSNYHIMRASDILISILDNRNYKLNFSYEITSSPLNNAVNISYFNLLKLFPEPFQFWLILRLHKNILYNCIFNTTIIILNNRKMPHDIWQHVQCTYYQLVKMFFLLLSFTETIKKIVISNFFLFVHNNVKCNAWYNWSKY